MQLVRNLAPRWVDWRWKALPAICSLTAIGYHRIQNCLVWKNQRPLRIPMWFQEAKECRVWQFRRDGCFSEHANTLRWFIPRPGSLSRVWTEFQYSEITGACFVWNYSADPKLSTSSQSTAELPSENIVRFHFTCWLGLISRCAWNTMLFHLILLGRVLTMHGAFGEKANMAICGYCNS